MSEQCILPARGFGFSPERIAETAARKGLLSMEIEFSLACNFKCPYCYTQAYHTERLLDPDRIDSIVVEAKELGAEKIIVLGGEPMIYPSIHDRLRFIHDQGLSLEMFTNGSHMSRENADFMFEHDVCVVLKMNSRDRALQNEMAGRDDAYDIIQSAFRNLLAAGYPGGGRRLAVSTVICEQNIGELPEMWRWLRGMGIEPYFEMITPQGGGTGGPWMRLSPARHRELFEELARIDREEFGLDWRPQPPLVGNSCLRHCFSCLVNAAGEVMPCVGVTIPLGNVLDTPLQTILERSEVLENLRNHRHRIKGPCGTCESSDECYGCRGAAYQLTGDYLASDPMCWHNQDKSIEKLPVNAARYLPHRPPMFMLDTLCSVGERCGRLSALIRPDNPFLDSDGVLAESAYVEITAQALAALEGFHMNSREREGHKGVLVGVKKFSVAGEARAGERLDVHIEKQGRFGGFGSVRGVVLRDGGLIAEGELSFFRNGDEEGDVMPA